MSQWPLQSFSLQQELIPTYVPASSQVVGGSSDARGGTPTSLGTKTSVFGAIGAWSLPPGPTGPPPAGLEPPPTPAPPPAPAREGAPKLPPSPFVVAGTSCAVRPPQQAIVKTLANASSALTSAPP
jgi:hypothetical protein